MFAILGLALVSMFSIGIASFTLKSDLHFKSNAMNLAIFVTFVIIIVIGAS